MVEEREGPPTGHCWHEVHHVKRMCHLCSTVEEKVLDKVGVWSWTAPEDEVCKGR
jgi:hypothetical protein